MKHPGLFYAYILVTLAAESPGTGTEGKVRSSQVKRSAEALQRAMERIDKDLAVARGVRAPLLKVMPKGAAEAISRMGGGGQQPSAILSAAALTGEHDVLIHVVTRNLHELTTFVHKGVQRQAWARTSRTLIWPNTPLLYYWSRRREPVATAVEVYRAYVFIKITDAPAAAVIVSLIDVPWVVQVAAVYGEYDVVATVQTENPDQREEVVGQHIRRIAGISSTSTSNVVLTEKPADNSSPSNERSAQKPANGGASALPMGRRSPGSVYWENKESLSRFNDAEAIIVVEVEVSEKANLRPREPELPAALRQVRALVDRCQSLMRRQKEQKYFAYVFVKGKTEDAFKMQEDLKKVELPGVSVLSGAILAGAYDAVLEVRTDDIARLRDLVIRRVRSISRSEESGVEWIEDTHTFIMHDVNTDDSQRNVHPWTDEQYPNRKYRAYVLVGVAKGRDSDVLTALDDVPEVVVASAIFGAYDIVVILQTELPEERETVVERDIRRIAGVDRVSTLTVWYAYSQSLFWVGPESVTERETDKAKHGSTKVSTKDAVAKAGTPVPADGDTGTAP